MAVNFYNPSSAREFVGLAADTKPLATNNGNGAIAPPRNGDRFIESDTGYVYIFNAGAWTKVTGAVFTAGG